MSHKTPNAPAGAALSLQFMQQKRARAEMSSAESEAVKVVEQVRGASVSTPQNKTTGSNTLSGEGGIMRLERSKRSTAGQIRHSRYLDDDIPYGGGTASCQRTQNPSAPNASVGEKRKSQVLLRDPLKISAGADPHDGSWVGDCIGRWKGNKLYGGALIGKEQYVAVGSDVLLKAEPGHDPYVARITRMFENKDDGMKMVTCKWFYRKHETELAKDKQRLSQVSDQELFMSDVEDDNALSAVDALCPILADFLVHDLDHWLQSRSRLVYQSSYLPKQGIFKQLSGSEMREAKRAFAAGARSERLTLAYARLGALQYASLEDTGDKAAVISVVVKQGEGAQRQRMEARVSRNWRQVLDGSVYKPGLAAPAPAHKAGHLRHATAVPGQQGKVAAEAEAREAEAAAAARASKQARKGGGGGGGGKQARAVEPSGSGTAPGSIVQEHQRIQWIGEPQDEAACKSGRASSSAAQVAQGGLQGGQKRAPGRRYYSKVLLGNGSEVRIGSAVILQAPEGEEPFLAQVEQLWENEADKFKMMRCRWFYRASEVAARFPRAIAPVPGLPPDALHKEIMCSDDVDDNYLTTIERPCCVMHLEAVPPDIRACWLKGPDNFFYRSKFAPRNKNPLTSLACPPPKVAADAESIKSSGKSGPARPAREGPPRDKRDPPRECAGVPGALSADAAAAACAPGESKAESSKRRLDDASGGAATPGADAQAQSLGAKRRKIDAASDGSSGRAEAGRGGSLLEDGAAKPAIEQAERAERKIARAGPEQNGRVDQPVQKAARLPPPSLAASRQQPLPAVAQAVTECVASMVTRVCAGLAPAD